MNSILPVAIMIILVFMISVALFQWLWNTTMPEAFGLREIRFWVAFRLTLIAGMLTSGGFIGASVL
ncbi:hypothetical protein [Rhodanobacter caeni]|uniref:hypothetical protein n=1 Tax=Rhodanobacter caeni TaxID=657654 RepID=UPI0031CF2B89